ncbi:Fatty acid desaturase domain-containing protein [Pseudomonas caricapapayae]|uniref:Fatty acid desaturase domain-containing protein n=1 Tax=Pseudomonas caricapapayae TaxID=46678 RepID=A0A3M6F4D4_9PSED|nr:Fatty acid desaturase domain-containing protein [Pseudomonas caricapapayae]
MSKPESRAGNNLALKAFTPAAELYVLKPWISLLALLADWGLIVLAFTCAALWPYPATYLFAALLIARSQLALAVIMHESAHGVLLPRQKPNDVVGQLAAAGPLFISMQTYRAGHLKHHLNPMQHDDPVVAVFGLGDYPQPKGKLATRLLADLCGVGYFISAFRFARGDYRAIMPKVEKSPRQAAWEVLSMLISNGLLFGLLAWSGHPLLYLGLWLLPAVTLLPLMGRIRAIMEHAGLPACADQSQNARSIVLSYAPTGRPLCSARMPFTITSNTISTCACRSITCRARIDNWWPRNWCLTKIFIKATAQSCAMSA